MKPIREVLPFILKIVDNFDGGISFKNSKGRYFFVNDYWLISMNLKSGNVIGKTAEEFMSTDNAFRTKKDRFEGS